MNQSNLLIRNVLVTYGRMAVTVGLGLYGTRLFFDALDDVDVGIFNVLGASAGLMGIITASLSLSAMRHLSICEGRNDTTAYAEIANTSYVLFLLIGLGILLVGQVVSPMVGWLNVPEDRRNVAFWVYQFSLLGVVQATLFTPIGAVLLSKQAIVLQAVIALPAAAAGVIAAAAVFVLPGDRLFNFSLIMLVLTTAASLAAALACFVLFPASRPRPKLFRRSLLGELGRFAGWAAIGNLSWDLRMKGASIILNIFFGPALNAAWAAAVRTCQYHSSLCAGVTTAAGPALIASEGAGRRKQARSLTLLGSKYASLVSLFLTVPLLFDMSNALTLWLGRVPDYAPMFAIVLIVSFSIDALTRSYGIAMHATGDIGVFTRSLLWVTLLPLPLAVAGYALGAGPLLIVHLILIVAVVGAWLKTRIAGRRIGFTIGEWLRQVVTPFVLTASTGGLAALPFRLWMPEGLTRLATIALVFALVALPVIWWLALEQYERDRFLVFKNRLFELAAIRRTKRG